MKKIETQKATRRQFLKTACGSGAGIVAGAASMNAAWAQDSTGGAVQPMPQRPFGKTGVNVPILGLGGSLNLMDQQLLLKQALKMGVTYWDTADNYSGGRSESGIGEYFSRHPEDRQRVFLVTKTGSTTPERMDRDLNESLKRLRTTYVDLYFLHGLYSVENEIDDGIRQWAEKAKSKGRIRFFGFSTHRNMATCLSQAAKLGWIDGIMMTYNFRLIGDDDMRRAVDACAQAGIGLIAMKTQGSMFSLKNFGRGGDLVQAFLDRGMTQYQARLKAVWENPRIAGICSHMDDMTILKENVAAALDRKALTRRERGLLDRYARDTATAYCSGCGDICESALDAPVPVADVLRCLMYARSYNDYQMAKEAFSKLPPRTRNLLVETDFSSAEKRCPRRLAVAELMGQAAAELG
jgi:hypothetical protein